ncbi:MAG: sulfotransferase domain-containing protein [Anaerolineales bacterium]
MQRGRIQVRGRVRWKLRRAGALLRHGPSRVGRLPIVFGNAIPKSGSKLLFNILRGLTRLGPFVDTGLNEIKPYLDGRPTPQPWINRQLDALAPGDIRLGYLYFHPDSLVRLSRPGWATFMIIRDPRDTIVSEVFYATDMHPGHALHEHMRSLPRVEDRIQALIGGIPEGPLRRVNVREHYERFLPWLGRPEVCLLRFEDLLRQREVELERMLGHLDQRGAAWDAPRDRAIAILAAEMAPGKSETFRQGRAQGWRDHFSPANKQLFLSVAGDLLERLGYESGPDW